MSSSRSRTPLVVGIVVVVVALAALIAVLAGGSDDVEATAIDEDGGVVEVVGDVLAPLPDAATDPAVGLAGPTLVGTDYRGEPVTIDPGASGRPTLVVFLAHWCPHCNAEVPLLNEWRDSADFPDGLDVVGVSTGVSSERPNYPPSNWLEAKDWTWPVLADSLGSDTEAPTALAAYGLSGYPFFTLLDSDGNVVARAAGEVPIEALAALVATVV